MVYSYSKVSMFSQCPYRYKLTYIDKLKVFDNLAADNALFLGTALHTGIETTVENGIKSYIDNYPVMTDLMENEIIKLENVISKMKAVIPDGRFEFKIDTPNFVGYIDLLVKVGENEFDIYDFKYSNSIESYLKSGQLHVYKSELEKMYPNIKVRDLYFVFAPKVAIRQKKTEDLYQFRKRLCEELSKKEVQVVKVEFDKSKIQEFADNIKKIESEKTFSKNPSRLCDWCPFKDYCQSNGKDTTNLKDN